MAAAAERTVTAAPGTPEHGSLGPRSRITPERETELYRAVLDLLREVGYDALTMDAIASRTRSSKATLYRQWKGKPQLVATALRRSKPVSVGELDTGSLRGDFQTLVTRLDDSRMADDSALLRGLFHAVHSHPDLLQALRELFIDPELTGLDALLRRAVDRGEIRADSPALSYVPHMVIGALIARPLVEDRPVDQAFLGHYFDSVLLPALGV